MGDMGYKTKAPDDAGIKDLWRTPPHIFAPVHQRFGFNLDAAAAPDTALCERYITAEQDALRCSWRVCVPEHERVRAWNNPPYSKIGDFVAKCAREAVADALVVALIPASVDVRWWHRYVIGDGTPQVGRGYALASEVWLYTGRLSFIHPVSGKPVAGNKFGSQIVVWDGVGSTWDGPRFGTLSHKTGEPVRQADRAYWYAHSSFGAAA